MRGWYLRLHKGHSIKNAELKAARTREVEIGKFLSAEHDTLNLRDPTNHCVKILDYFRDSIDPGVEYIVMPLLRPFNDPTLGFVGEVVDFVTQVIEVGIHCHLCGIKFTGILRERASFIASWSLTGMMLF